MLRCSLAALLFFTSIAPAQPANEPLVEKVGAAIDRGTRYLRRVEAGRGHWETNEMSL